MTFGTQGTGLSGQGSPHQHVNFTNLTLDDVVHHVDGKPHLFGYKVGFDIGWNDCWRDSVNHDAVWVFCKFKETALWRLDNEDVDGFFKALRSESWDNIIANTDEGSGVRDQLEEVREHFTIANVVRGRGTVKLYLKPRPGNERHTEGFQNSVEAAVADKLSAYILTFDEVVDDDPHHRTFRVSSNVSKHWLPAVFDTNAAAHKLPNGATCTPAEDGLGVFIARDAENRGAGPVMFKGVEFFWPRPARLLADVTEEVSIWLMGVEMVYIPEGPFCVGDPAGGVTAQFSDGRRVLDKEVREHGGDGIKPHEGICYEIRSEDAITCSSLKALEAAPPEGPVLTWNNAGQNGKHADIPATFPKGYDAFYLMKRQVTQGQYTDYMNTLSGDANTVRFPYGGQGGYRFTIRKAKNGDRVALRPLRACNWLSWGDGIGWLWWAGLRPYTELEFTKAARGPMAPVSQEYAWGNRHLQQSTIIVGDESDGRSVCHGNANLGNAETEFEGGDGGEGPTCDDAFGALDHAALFSPAIGSFRTGSPKPMPRLDVREAKGTGYYGVYGLTGNLWEYVITAGNDAGRSFEGEHGIGVLDGSGLPRAGAGVILTWPEHTADGAGFRGGSWYTHEPRGRLADRGFGSGLDNYNSRSHDTGCRGARTAPKKG